MEKIYDSLYRHYLSSLAVKKSVQIAKTAAKNVTTDQLPPLQCNLHSRQKTFWSICGNIAKVKRNACPPSILTRCASLSKWANPPLGLLLPFAQPTRREI